MTMSPNDTEQRARIVAETGKITWGELQPHFARGALILVARGLDMVDVAIHLAQDDKAALERWLCEGGVARIGEREARAWANRPPVFWAVVVAPWVLVQEVEEPDTVN